MCGVAGYIGSDPPPRERVTQTLGRMRNRGPDHQAFVELQAGPARVLLLHSRLAILDLDARSNQPFRGGDSALAFNGEIYNYLELRQSLAAAGERFTTSSDTEVVMRGCLRRGPTFVEEMEGMWAFALFEATSGRLWLSRDRFGEKPLYYLRRPQGIYFGSEPKFIEALAGTSLRPNRRQLLRYLVNGYKSLYKTADTFFDDLVEVPPATTLEIAPDLTVRARRYWQPRSEPEDMSLEEAVAGFRERLLDSVSLRLRADVPMAFCLSGGVDSAAITSIAAKEMGYRVHSFSIVDPDPRYDEWDNIQATVTDLGCSHTVIRLPRPGALERLRRLVAYHDGPVATISYLVHSYLSEEIARLGFKVAFSGTGADELVTGYYDHFNLHLYETRGTPGFEDNLTQWRRWIQPLVRNPHLGRPDLYFDDPGFRAHIYLDNEAFSGFLREPFREAFVESHYCESLLRNRMMNEMFAEGTRVIVHEDDLNSMMFSVENRSPFLDSELFAFAYSIPAEHLIRDGYGKYVLRQAVAGLLNDRVRLDRRKKGFNASIHSILDFTDPATRADILAPSPVYDLVKQERIADMLDGPPLSDSYNKFFFSFLNVKLFLEQRV